MALTHARNLMTFGAVASFPFFKKSLIRSLVHRLLIFSSLYVRLALTCARFFGDLMAFGVVASFTFLKKLLITSLVPRLLKILSSVALTHARNLMTFDAVASFAFLKKLLIRSLVHRLLIFSALYVRLALTRARFFGDLMAFGVVASFTFLKNC